MKFMAYLYHHLKLCTIRFCGRTSTRDKPRLRRVKLREIFEAMGISHGTVITIFHEKLSMKKLLARWVPRLLIVENKCNRVSDSMAGLALFCPDPSEFLHWYTTLDETWIHFYTPETKEQSKQWTAPGELAPKKAKTVKSAGNMMGIVY